MDRQRVALYARVSTVNGQQDPEMQLRELREYAVRRGLEVTGEFIDHGVSGSKDSRPALNRLMADAIAKTSVNCPSRMFQTGFQ
jgi:DNA invertase Pin-like site-specific DNA recombinase